MEEKIEKRRLQVERAGREMEKRAKGRKRRDSRVKESVVVEDGPKH